MTLAQKAYELQEKINRCIDTYGECVHDDADELNRLCDMMTNEDEDEFLSLYESSNSK